MSCIHRPAKRAGHRSDPFEGFQPRVGSIEIWIMVLLPNHQKLERQFLKQKNRNIATWWFQVFFIFTPTWGNDLIWLIFFKRVETTNQIDCLYSILFSAMPRADHSNDPKRSFESPKKPSGSRKNHRENRIRHWRSKWWNGGFFWQGCRKDAVSGCKVFFITSFRHQLWITPIVVKYKCSFRPWHEWEKGNPPKLCKMYLICRRNEPSVFFKKKPGWSQVKCDVEVLFSGNKHLTCFFSSPNKTPRIANQTLTRHDVVNLTPKRKPEAETCLPTLPWLRLDCSKKVTV